MLTCNVIRGTASRSTESQTATGVFSIRPPIYSDHHITYDTPLAPAQGQALADDTQHQVGPVDRTDFQRGGLADAQAAGRNDGEVRLVDRVADVAEQVADLVV